jgi:hypothetical protein
LGDIDRVGERAVTAAMLPGCEQLFLRRLDERSEHDCRYSIARIEKLFFPELLAFLDRSRWDRSA